MQRYEPLPGDDILHACTVLVQMAPAVMSFNDIEITAQPNDAPNMLVAQYHAENKRRYQAYIASDEYKQACECAEAAERERARKFAEAMAGAPDEPTFADRDGWDRTVAANQDGYGGGVITYARQWARMMEARIVAGSTVVECAEETSHLADTEGITGFMYGCAVSILSKCWILGEDLRRWHNRHTQIRDEGDRANDKPGAVLNPALLSLG